jgi:hypothetical protein
LRQVLSTYQELSDKDQVDDYFPAQAQFFLGESFRLHFEAASLDPERGVDQLAKDLEYKAELLLSAQGHYLRSIRIGNGYWATAAGAQIGGLYESFYDHLIHSPAPKELNPEEAEVYRQEVRKKIRVLLTKAITIYERTLETAERIGSVSPFTEKTREKLQKMKELLLADAKADEEELLPTGSPSGSSAPDTPLKTTGPRSSRPESKKPAAGRSPLPLPQSPRPHLPPAASGRSPRARRPTTHLYVSLLRAT